MLRTAWTISSLPSCLKGLIVCGLIQLIMTLPSGFLIAPAHGQSAEEEEATILDDFGNEHEGIFQLNQESGAFTSQLNAVSVGFSADGTSIADASASQTLIDPSGSAGAFSGAIPDAILQNGLGTSSGLLAVNQSSGTAGLQSNQIAVAIGEGEDSLAAATATSLTSAITMADISPILPASFGSSLIANTGNLTEGLVSINQESGFATTQSNVIALASAPDGIATATAIRLHDGARPGDAGQPPIDLDGVGPAGLVSITDSFNGASGLVQIAQASGSYNRQSNLLAIAFGSQAVAHAVGDEALASVQSDPAVSVAPATSDDAPGTELANSFAGFNGLAQIAQVSGHNNVTNNTLAVSVSTLPIGGAGG